ncbi:MAG: FecR domain-containing protein [Glaciimonas sp.]|nr:FecR domain-containing protein [Glaciimonas sp.]
MAGRARAAACNTGAGSQGFPINLYRWWLTMLQRHVFHCAFHYASNLVSNHASRWLMAAACIFACGGTLAADAASSAEVAGTVALAIGEATLQDASGAAHAAARGDAVRVGQTLLTGANGHIHVRMVDGAFVSVRPQSRFRIEEYRYDPALPSNNRVKFVLEQGVARSITGRAGEAAREHYRLNTPLAAIGIRGTDFVVQASAEVTRVLVQSGAVSMSPLGTDCLASASGPCNTTATRVLSAAMRNAYLELGSRSSVPLLVPASKALNSPNLIAPPQPEEPAVVSKADSANLVSRDAQRDSNVKLALKNAREEYPPAAVVQEPIATAPVLPILPVLPSQFWWGRYVAFDAAYVPTGKESLARDVLLATLAPSTRETVVGNDMFALLQPVGSFSMPKSGSFDFKLAESEAYIVRDDRTRVSAATISSPLLNINFGASTYATALTVNGSGIAPLSVQSTGTIGSTGRLNAGSKSVDKFDGILSNDSSQAAYIFQQGLKDGFVAGATRWVR